MDGVLVPGTETGVGKTLVAAAVGRSRPGEVYVKPVQTGPAAREGLTAMAPVLALIPQLGATRPQDLPEIAW